jgi:hypothetical protein
MGEGEEGIYSTDRTEPVSRYPLGSKQDCSPRLIGDILLLPRCRIIPLIPHVEAFQPVVSLLSVLGSFFRGDDVAQYSVLTGDVSISSTTTVSQQRTPSRIKSWINPSLTPTAMGEAFAFGPTRVWTGLFPYDGGVEEEDSVASMLTVILWRGIS